MAFKTFSNGSVLTDTDLNDYLMVQSVIVCTTGTRPASPVTGMTVFETDTKLYRRYNGSAWKHILNSRPMIMLTKGTASISNNSLTKISWDSDYHDDYGMWSSGTVVTIPSGMGAIWNVILSVRWASQTTVSGYRQCRIDVNGAEQNVFNLAPTTALNSTNVVTHLTHPMELQAGDQVEAQVYQNSGGALSIIGPTRMVLTYENET